MTNKELLMDIVTDLYAFAQAACEDDSIDLADLANSARNTLFAWLSICNVNMIKHGLSQHPIVKTHLEVFHD